MNPKTVVCISVLVFFVAVLFVACGEDDTNPDETDTGDDAQPEVETIELLDNRDFDDGTTAPWVESSAGGEPLIVFEDELPIVPHSGGFAAWLGGTHNADDRLTQRFELPATSQTMNIQFALYVASEHRSGEPARDVLDVLVTDLDGDIVRTLATYSNGTESNAWKIARIEDSDLLTLRDRPLRLEFRATTDGAAITDFFLDTVSLEATYVIPTD